MAKSKAKERVGFGLLQNPTSAGVGEVVPGVRSVSMDPYDVAVRAVEAKNGGASFSANPTDILNFEIPLQRGIGHNTSIEIPQWLADQAKQYAGRTGFSLAGPEAMGVHAQPGALGDTTYKVGDTIFSGAHTGGYAADANTDIARRFDPNSFVSYANSPEYQQALATGKWTLLNGTPYNVLDNTGKVIGTKKFEGLEDEDNMDMIALALTGAAIGGMGLTAAGGGAGAGAAGGTTAGGTGAGGAATLGGGGAPMSSFGFVDGTVGTGIGGSTGTGLSLGGGGLGLNAGAGEGLALSNGANGLGMTAASPGAGTIGGGLGSGFAGGSGSLLGSTALQGTTTLADGTILPASGSGASTAVPPSANPGAGGTAAGGAGALGGNGNLLGAGSSLLGAVTGGKGQKESQSVEKNLPDYLKAPVNDLIARTQGLLSSQMPAAQQAGNQMMTVGRGLLAAPVAGNGVGQVEMAQGPAKPDTKVAANGFGLVQMDTPDTQTNPYLSGIADDIQRRALELLADNNLAIQGNAVASGGLGGSRQGVAQGIAAGRTTDALAGQLAGLYGNAYESDMNRALQKYQADQGFYSSQRAQDIGLRDQDLSTYNQALNRNLQKYGLDQGFYGQQRAQDLQQATLGAGLLSSGLDTQFQPLKDATSVYSPFSGFGTTTQNTSSGGGLSGAIGGALSGAAFGHQMGWW